MTIENVRILTRKIFNKSNTLKLNAIDGYNKSVVKSTTKELELLFEKLKEAFL